MIESWRGKVGRAFSVLDDALERSPLPEEPRNTDALDTWLLEVRREGLG